MRESLPLVACGPLSARLLEATCVQRWTRAQTPRTEEGERYRPLSFDACRYCPVGAARAGGDVRQRPEPAPPDGPTAVEQRQAAILAYLLTVDSAEPGDVLDALDEDVSRAVVRKELSEMRRAGVIVRDGYGIYRHPDVERVVAPAPPPFSITRAQIDDRRRAMWAWVEAQPGEFRPSELLAAMRASVHPMPEGRRGQDVVIGFLTGASSPADRIESGAWVYSPLALDASRRASAMAKRLRGSGCPARVDRSQSARVRGRRAAARFREQGIEPSAVAFSGDDVLTHADGGWMDPDGQCVIVAVLPMSVVPVRAAS